MVSQARRAERETIHVEEVRRLFDLRPLIAAGLSFSEKDRRTAQQQDGPARDVGQLEPARFIEENKNQEENSGKS